MRATTLWRRWVGMPTSVVTASLAGLSAYAQSPDSLQARIFEARDRVASALVNVQPITDVYSSGERRSSTGVGSGFILDADGHVITNYHVAGKAKRLIITLSDKRRVSGVLVGEDPLTDIAVLRIEPAVAGLPEPVTLGDSARLEVGEYVMALGSPLALERSLSFGVVSSKNRYLPDSFKLPTGEKTGSFNTWIQTDAAINPGNSGGPLVDLGGKVVGVNARGAFGASSIGFAIPINIVREVVSELIEHGRVKRSWLGLEFQPREELSQYYDAGDRPGVVISSVAADSPAERAGLRAGDVLVSLDGTPVSAEFTEQLPVIYKRVADTPIGKDVELVAYRGADQLRLVASTEERSRSSSDEMECASWGFTARGITKEVVREFNLPDGDGVFVAGVRPNDVAFRARLFPGDRIVEIEGEKLRDLAHLEEVYRGLDASESSPVLLTVMRRHSRRLILIEAGYEAAQ